MATGGFRFEVAPQRDMAGNGPVVRYEVQESRGLDETGTQAWHVWKDTEDKDEAVDSYRVVKSFPGNAEIRLVKVTTEVMEVPPGP